MESNHDHEMGDLFIVPTETLRDYNGDYHTLMLNYRVRFNITALRGHFKLHVAGMKHSKQPGQMFLDMLRKYTGHKYSSRSRKNGYVLAVEHCETILKAAQVKETS